MTNSKPFATHRFNIRVYYEDTDAGGVVFYANYLKFMERGRTEWLRALGVDQSGMARELKRGFMVTELDLKYHKPARLDDLLEIESRITRLGRASINFQQRVLHNNEVLAQGNIQICCVDTVNMRAVALPPVVSTKLKVISQD
jgi:acyl-CoA thioester hydrolase